LTFSKPSKHIPATSTSSAFDHAQGHISTISRTRCDHDIYPSGQARAIVLMTVPEPFLMTLLYPGDRPGQPVDTGLPQFFDTRTAVGEAVNTGLVYRLRLHCMRNASGTVIFNRLVDSMFVRPSISLLQGRSLTLPHFFYSYQKTNRKNLQIPNLAQNWAKLAFLNC
jgi:hypothetical protein